MQMQPKDLSKLQNPDDKDFARFARALANLRSRRGFGNESLPKWLGAHYSRMVIRDAIENAAKKLTGEQQEMARKLSEFEKSRFFLKNRQTGEFFRKALLENTPLLTSPSDRHNDIDIIAILHMRKRKSLSFLDVGSGFYEDCAPTTRKTIRLFSEFEIDVSATALDREVPAEMHGTISNSIRYLCADMFDKDLVFDLLVDAKFDYIRFGHVLYHFTEEKRRHALGTFKTFLAKDGLMVETPCPAGGNAIYKLDSAGQLEQVPMQSLY